MPFVCTADVESALNEGDTTTYMTADTIVKVVNKLAVRNMFIFENNYLSYITTCISYTNDNFFNKVP